MVFSEIFHLVNELCIGSSQYKSYQPYFIESRFPVLKTIEVLVDYYEDIKNLRNMSIGNTLSLEAVKFDFNQYNQDCYLSDLFEMIGNISNRSKYFSFSLSSDCSLIVDQFLSEIFYLHSAQKGQKETKDLQAENKYIQAFN